MSIYKVYISLGFHKKII